MEQLVVSREETLWRMVLQYVEKDVDESLVMSKNHEGINLVDDLGYDSVAFVSLIVDIEDEFGFTISDEILSFEKMVNYAELMKIVEREGTGN